MKPIVAIIRSAEQNPSSPAQAVRALLVPSLIAPVWRYLTNQISSSIHSLKMFFAR